MTALILLSALALINFGGLTILLVMCFQDRNLKSDSGWHNE